MLKLPLTCRAFIVFFFFFRATFCNLFLSAFQPTVPPDIINEESSADISVQEGEDAALVCRATGHPQPRVTWRREDNDYILMRKPGSRELVKGESLWKIIFISHWQRHMINWLFYGGAVRGGEMNSPETLSVVMCEIKQISEVGDKQRAQIYAPSASMKI